MTTKTIDWNAPLEAYHPDGRTRNVALDQDAIQPDFDGHYWLSEGIESCWYFEFDGSPTKATSWRIRNRTEPPVSAYPEEMVERMVALTKRVSDFFPLGSADSLGHEARAIMAEMEAKVDPLDAVWDALPANIATCVDASEAFRAELAKRGLAITETAPSNGDIT